MSTEAATPELLTLAAGLQVLPVPHPGGCRSYLLLEPNKLEALAVDIHLDSVREAASQLIGGGWDLKYIVDTHTHADFPSGSKALNEWFGTTRVAHPAAGHRGVDHTPKDGEVLGIGDTSVTVQHAPGHTPDHMVLTTGDALFSGDSLFIGGVARTDFLGGDAAQLYETLQKLLGDVGDDAWLFPGHDYKGRLHSKVGTERGENPWLQLKDRDEFVARLRDGKPPEPANMQALLQLNREGVDIPARVTVATAIDLIRKGGGGSVIDVRTDVEASLARIPDSVNIPADLIEIRADDVRRVPAPRLLICGTSRRSTKAQATLDAIGIQALSVVEGGMAAYVEAEGPLDTPGKVIPLHRQAAIASGSLVLLSALLGMTVAPWLGWLAIAVAIDRIAAGIFGTGAIDTILKAMPWNESLAAIESIAGGCAAELPPPSCAAE